MTVDCRAQCQSFHITGLRGIKCLCRVASCPSGFRAIMVFHLLCPSVSTLNGLFPYQTYYVCSRFSMNIINLLVQVQQVVRFLCVVCRIFTPGTDVLLLFPQAHLCFLVVLVICRCCFHFLYMVVICASCGACCSAALRLNSTAASTSRAWSCYCSCSQRRSLSGASDSFACCAALSASLLSLFCAAPLDIRKGGGQNTQ